MTGDFIGNGTAFNVEKATGGTFAGLENRFFPREIELSLFGQIDPYARAEVRIEAGAGDRSGEISVTLAEANLTLMTLPFGTQAKLGLMRNRFGLTNAIHEHDLPFIDRPNVLVRFLGEEGLAETGLEATWVAPLPFFLELLGGVFNGDNETAFGRGSFRAPLVTGRVRTFFDLEELGAFQLGASVASGQTSDRKSSTLIGFDAKYKYRPEGWERALFSVGGEYLYAIRDVVVTDPDLGTSETKTNRRDGWYVYGEVQPVRFGFLSRWSLGFRYDWTEFPENPGHEWAVQPYLTFSPSEFLRFRLGYKHTERSSRGRRQPERRRARATWTRSCSRPRSSWARIPPIRSNRSRGETDMRRLTLVALAAVATVSALVPPAPAADRIRVVATTTDLKALTEAVGGDLVEVGRARPRQPEPARPRGAPEPHGQGAAGRRPRDERARAATAGPRSWSRARTTPR